MAFYPMKKIKKLKSLVAQKETEDPDFRFILLNNKKNNIQLKLQTTLPHFISKVFSLIPSLFLD
jgi:U3 small nucleolar RNA-associated protein 14